jgi:tetratricopeptide (TPR) repeat protein
MLMRRLRLYIFALLIIFAAVPATAQEESVDITIYRDADSLIIYTPGGPLYGLALQVTLPDNRVLTQSLVAYPAFRGTQVGVPACFRLERADSNITVPLDCQNAQNNYIQPLVSGDVFWHDSTQNQDFTVMIVRDDQIYGVCGAGMGRCMATFIPEKEPDGPCDGAADLENREVLVVIATFRRISGVELEPHFEWELILNDSIEQLQGQVNARVLVVPQIITSQQEALDISDCFNATLVIWGVATAARVESNYTTKARWSKIDALPDASIFEINPAQPQSTIDQLIIYVSLEGGDTKYILNSVLAQLVYFDDNYEEALPLLEAAIGLVPKGREREMGAAAMYFYIGYIQRAIYGDSDASRISYSRGLDIDPDGRFAAEAHYNRGLAFSDQANYELAIADFTQAIALNSNLTEAYFGRGVAYYDQQEYALATADYDQAIALSPNYAEVYNNRGLVFADLGDYQLAIEDFTRSIVLNNTMLHVPYLNRGNIYRFEGNYESAIADYDHAINLKPDYTFAYYNRGQVYNHEGRYVLAITDYDQAITLKPDYARAYEGRGVAFYHQGNYEQAIADFTRAIDLNIPDMHLVYYNRGNAYYDQGDFEYALADLTQAITLRPDYAEAHTFRGIVYRSQGEYMLAIADYDQAIALKPDSNKGYSNRGNAYYDQGNFEAAFADYGRSIELCIEDCHIDYYIRGTAYRRQGEYQQALADYNRAIILKPDYSRAYYNRGIIYYIYADDVQAIKDFTHAITLDPDCADCYAGLGQTYDAIGNYNVALVNYHRYLELTSENADPFYAQRVRELEAATPTATP